MSNSTRFTFLEVTGFWMKMFWSETGAEAGHPVIGVGQRERMVVGLR